MTRSKSDYTIGWISALEVELAPAMAMLSQPLHPDLPKHPADSNTYTLGQIGSHNVVVAGLPSGSIGESPAVHAATNLMRSFPNIRCIFMVGVGGGVSDASQLPMKDVRLGDIVVGNPEDNQGGVVQYDFGTAIQTDDPNQSFIKKGTLNKPPIAVRTALTKLRAQARLKGYQFERFYHKMLEDFPRLQEEYQRPKNDRLYQSDYIHLGKDCSECLDSKLVIRKPRKTEELVVHYGIIGSANQVVRNALLRDRLYNDVGLICFEMEAAGLMDLGCVVIRGICDYCDSHKNKDWQPYASAVAAAFTKELIFTMPVEEVLSSAPMSNELVAEVHEQTEEIRRQHEMIRRIEATIGAGQAQNLKEKDLECLRNLSAVDSKADRNRLEEVKGGLLRDAYKWILKNEQYQSWINQINSRLLWIRGDAGKGKTMLLCGISHELDYRSIYFFCQATNSANSTATGVLKGLVYSLAKQKPELLEQVRTKINNAATASEDNAFYLLTEVFEDMLHGLEIFILIDALDECQKDCDKLIRFISQMATTNNNRSRWIVSSRNYSYITEQLNGAENLSLELNAKMVSQAVEIYLEYKVNELAKTKQYNEELKMVVREYLSRHAGHTFLWVALVCDNLRRTKVYRTEVMLKALPSGLNELYERMFLFVEETEDSNILIRILATMAIVYRPVSLQELILVLELPTSLRKHEWLVQTISDCGAFLALQNDYVTFVHESAKAFVEEKLVDMGIGRQDLDSEVFQRSVETMTATLHRDIYNLKEPDASNIDLKIPTPDPLYPLTYSCLYWSDHLARSGRADELLHQELLMKFLRRSYLYWLEAMSLLNQTPRAIKIVSDLEFRIRQHSQANLLEFVEDALQFVLFIREAIKHYPLQVYYSGLCFSPLESLVRLAFQKDLPNNVNLDKKALQNWSLRTIEVSSMANIQDIAFSSDDKQLAINYRSGMEILDSATGVQLFCINLPDILQVVTTSQPGDDASCLAAGEVCMTVDGQSKFFLDSLAFTDGDHAILFFCHQVGFCRWHFYSGRIESLHITDQTDCCPCPAYISPKGNYVVYRSSQSDEPFGRLIKRLNLATINLNHNKLSKLSDFRHVSDWTYDAEQTRFAVDGTGLAIRNDPNNKYHTAKLSVMVWKIENESVIVTEFPLDVWSSFRIGSDFALGPQCKTIATVEVFMNDVTLTLWDIAARTSIWTVRRQDHSVFFYPTFSTDGKYFTVSIRGRIFLYNTELGVLNGSMHSSKLAQRVVFSNDSRQLATIQTSGRTMTLVRCSMLQSEGTIRERNLNVVQTYWSYSSGEVVLAFEDEYTEIWNARTSERIWRGKFEISRFFPLRYSFLLSDGYSLWRLTGDKLSKLWSNLVDGEDYHYKNYFGVFLSPYGQHLAIYDVNKELSLMRTDSYRIKKIGCDYGRWLEAAWSEDCSYFAILNSYLRKQTETTKQEEVVVNIWNLERLQHVRKASLTISCSPRGYYLQSANLSLQHGIVTMVYRGRDHGGCTVHVLSLATQMVNDFYIPGDILESTVTSVSSDGERLVLIRQFQQMEFNDIQLLTLSSGNLIDSARITDLENVRVACIKGNQILTNCGVIREDGTKLYLGTDTNIFYTGSWIMRDNRKVLWIPPAFRSVLSPMGQSLVAANRYGGYILISFGGDNIQQ